MTREHMEKGEKKVDKTEDKRVVHSFTFSLSFSYNRFFLSIRVYTKTVRPSDRPKWFFTVLPEQNRTSQIKFCLPNRTK